MKRIALVLLLPILLLGGYSRAAAPDEGMWLMAMLKELNGDSLRKAGLKISVAELYSEEIPSLKDAVVIFGGGCTGEMISNTGLVLTNHHCGYDFVQEQSSMAKNILDDGFVAKNRQEEIPTPGLVVQFLVSSRDVTKELLQGISMEDSEESRMNKLRENYRTLMQDKVDDEFNYHRVDGYYGGNVWYLNTYQRFTDVRMVFIPPSSIGKFGGETDNWMYPRHTGDFSLFRVYAGKDNKPANYSPDNQPYKPKRHLNVSIAGYKEGDFAMVIGNPGSTERNLTSWEIESKIANEFNPRADVRGVKQDSWKKFMNADPAIRLKYAAKYASSSNYWKNAIGAAKALTKNKVAERKRVEETQFDLWMQKEPERKKVYGPTLDLIKNATLALGTLDNVWTRTIETFYYGCELNGFAMEFDWLDKHTGKKDDLAAIQSTYGPKETWIQTVRKFFKDYDLNTDKATYKVLIKRFQETVPAEHLPSIYQSIEKTFKGDLDAYVDNIFAKSIFVDSVKFLKYLENPSVRNLKADPAWNMMKSTMELIEKLRDARKDHLLKLAQGQRLYIAARKEMKPYTSPDANFTMRLTYGQVKSYSPGDGAHYNYYTTLKGVMQKEDPTNPEFVVHPKLKELYRNGDYGRYKNESNELPVCFITTNDITGGNSGSPVMDATGALIGVAFDGNWESLSGDISFEDEMQRCIVVDIRYVLFVIEKWGNARHIVDELNLVAR